MKFLKKNGRKLITILMVGVMLSSMLLADFSMVYAQEDVSDIGYDDIEFYSEEDIDDPQPDPGPMGQPKISASTNIVSFGHVEQGCPVENQQITITNSGPSTVNLDWQLCDANGVFKIIAPGSSSLAPAESTTLYVDFNESNPEGYYSANLIVCPVGAISATVNIGISAEIVVRKPYITRMSVNPSSVDLIKGSNYQFSADVRGENNPDLRVTWSVSGATNSSVDNNGCLTIGTNETAERFAVVITSVFDPECVEFAIVNIKEGTYNVTTRCNPSSGGFTGGGGTVTGGKDIEVYANPNNGYRFVSWTKDGKVLSNTQKFVIKNVKANYDLVANFELANCYVKVNSNIAQGGSVSESKNVSYNGSYTLNASPKSGFRFEGWYENGKRISTDTKVTINNITSNREFTANFVQDVFKVETRVNPDKVGAVSGSGSYKRGTNVAFTAKALDGYEFDCWTSNNNLISRDANFTLKNIDKDYVLVANFKKKNAKTFNITAKVDAGEGVISPSGTASIPENADVTYTFAPGKGYTIGAVTVDGKNLGVVPSYTFKKVNGEHKISVSFTKIPEEHVHKSQQVTPSKQITQDKKKTTLDNNSKTDKKQEEKHENIIKNDSDVDTEAEDNEEEFKPSAVEEEALDYFLDMTELTGVLQKYNISELEARTMIRAGQDIPLLEKACEEQFLAVSVHNEYADIAHETESMSYMAVPSIPNLTQVVDSLLTEDEKIDIFAGDPVWINLNIFANNQMQTEDDKKLIQVALKDHVEIGNFFEIAFMKNKTGASEMITELSVPMQIVMDVPENLKAEGRQFVIMRAHKQADGSILISYLQNESTDKNKIMFTTDKFSSYALAYVGGKDQTWTQMKILKVISIVMIVVVSFLIVLTIVLIAKRRR